MLKVINLPVSELKPNNANARTHSKKQIKQIARSIQQFGFINPVLADEHHGVIAGHGRLAAAAMRGLPEVPVILLSGLTGAQKRALMIADNKIAENAGWDREKLAIELPALGDLLLAEGLDIDVTGFEVAEIDQLVCDFSFSPVGKEEAYEETTGAPVNQIGDLWQLGQHRLLCGDARDSSAIDRVMSGEVAAMAFLDPPYNLAVNSLVGRGQIKHREFHEASGEMSREEFVRFLAVTLANVARVTKSGGLHYVCMDWRHALEILSASHGVYNQHVNTAVWVKSNAGQGSFYRSQHEDIYVFRVGDDVHLNNIELGRHGRSRSNVWNYPGVNTFKRGRLDDLRAHPTVKPVALVSDAMRDCTKRHDNVIDTFAGSGTTILAAESVGRRGYAIEIDPLYADTTIRRWQLLTGKDAVNQATGATFEDCRAQRSSARKEA